MNTKLILASLVLGSSSVAMASPSVNVSATAHGTLGATVVRDHRGIDPDCNDPAVSHPTILPVSHPTILPAPVHWRDGKVWGPGDRMPPVYRTVSLASGMHFAGDGRTFITVGSQMGRFGSLQLTAAAGRTFIKQVYVQFDNGESQVIRNLNRTLIGNQTLTLDLDGNRRAIRRIVVYGNDLPLSYGNQYGWRRAAGTFNVMAL
jgi:hypothetical protein